MTTSIRSAALLAALALAACGHDQPDKPTAAKAVTPDPTEDPAVIGGSEPTPTPPRGSDAATVRHARPVHAVASTVFAPRFHVKLPKGWTANDIDDRTWATYIGADEMASPGELSLAGDYEGGSPRAALARMRHGHHVRATPVRAYRAGGRTVLGFEAPTVKDDTSFGNGLHNGTPHDYFRIMAFRGPRGKTLLAFDITTSHRYMRAFGPASLRVLGTLR